jgi:hypothetical protein
MVDLVIFDTPYCEPRYCLIKNNKDNFFLAWVKPNPRQSIFSPTNTAKGAVLVTTPCGKVKQRPSI